MTHKLMNQATRGHTDQEPDYRHVRDASVRGAGAGALALVAKTLLRLGSIVLLARLLTPADFGLIAMAGTVLSLFVFVADLGLHMASVQRRQLSADELSTLFWINVVGGVLLASLTVASAPLLVLIFDEPRVIGAAAALSLTLVAIGVGTQHEAVLRRRLSYSFLHVSGIISQTLGLGVALVSALAGASYWALILQQIVAHVSRVTLLWAKTHWRPRRPGPFVDVLPMLRYGSQLVPAHLLAHTARSFGEVLVGVSAGAAELGQFRRAHGMATLVEEARLPLKTIVPASLSRLQDRGREFARFYLHAISASSFAGCAFVGWMAAEAPAAVIIVLGDQWLAAIPLIRWLAPAGLAVALGTATEWLLMPLGHMKRLLALRAVRLGVIVVGVLFGWRWGVIGVAAGYSGAACISVGLELFGATAGTTVEMRRLTVAIVRPILAAVGAGYLVYNIQTPVSIVPFLLELLCYVAVFATIHTMLPGGWTVTRSLFRAVRRTVRPRPDTL